MTFDPHTATEQELNDEYKRRFAEAMQDAGVSSGWELPVATRTGLAEQLRRWWESWYGAGDAAARHAARAERAAARRAAFEEQYGVSDKAPPRAVPVSGAVAAPTGSASRTAPDTAPSRTAAPTGTTGAGTGSPSRTAASRTASPSTGTTGAEPEQVAEQDGAGSAAEVDRAMRAVFGHSLEDGA